jgi:hypothetical protein
MNSREKAQRTQKKNLKGNRERLRQLLLRFLLFALFPDRHRLGDPLLRIAAFASLRENFPSFCFAIFAPFCSLPRRRPCGGEAITVFVLLERLAHIIGYFSNHFWLLLSGRANQLVEMPFEQSCIDRKLDRSIFQSRKQKSVRQFQ